MKPLFYSIVAGAAALWLGGCGGTGGSATDVTAERGPMLYALVTDASGQQATMLSGGRYRFANDPVYPVTSRGGVIDINRNGLIDAGDLAAPELTLQTPQGRALTLVTSLAHKAQIATMLQNDFNLSTTRIFNATPSGDSAIAAISDELYKYCVEHNVSDPSTLTLKVMQSLQAQIAARIGAYASGEFNATKRERYLVKNELGLRTMTQAEADAMNRQLSERDGTPQLSELNSTLRGTLAFMWNEEKMAKELYLALHALWPHKEFYNIAMMSESQHQAAIESLLLTYDINVTDIDGDEAHYSAEELQAYAAGIFPDTGIQSLYDELYAKGAQTDQDALEAGCMVEVTDVNDLTANIALAAAAEADDLVATFTSLRKASYNHYWAFDGALKILGVTEGCCVLGGTFCKTPEEYPDTRGGGGA
ncbi:DUF2202 domain-containing protein [Sulfurimonas sp. HSL1-2]|uniref:DUF2202 domain-containing protein n=1 Tax=Thiomicrolovo zhangzhouensis TaxID=3131933 RepID=UPI0031F9B75A